jgi:hypothetical protein
MSDSDRQANGRFAAGNPGGPGRPRSGVAATAAALDKAAAEVQLELLRVVLDQARAGNLQATRLLWARIWPARRDRPVAFDVPAIRLGSDLLEIDTAVNDAVLSGEITGDEAAVAREAIRQQIITIQHYQEGDRRVE